MNEQLRHRADAIIELLQKHPKNGAHLLLDFARQYAADKGLDDEVIMLKLDYEGAEDDTERQNILNQLLALVETIVKDYDESAVQALEEKEKQIAAQAKEKEVSEETVLRIENLRKTYQSTNFKLKADHLELKLGQITGLLGENATGKTTLFRILAGELAKDKGQMAYPLFQASKKRLNWIKIKGQIAYVPQELSSWHGPLRENIRYEAASRGLRGKAVEKATDYIIQRLGLAPHIEKSWRQLSGGYKLRFALAKALVWGPRLLIIDEPLAFLDVRAQLVVLNDLKLLAKNLRNPIAVVLSSQHVHEMEAVADQLLFMQGGELVHIEEKESLGNDRTQNVFEFTCSLEMNQLINKLQGLDYQNLTFTGLNYVMYTNLETQTQELLQNLLSKGIDVSYFRDISQSLKTRFYEKAN